jgi:hypothetical protein
VSDAFAAPDPQAPPNRGPLYRGLGSALSGAIPVIGSIMLWLEGRAESTTPNQTGPSLRLTTSAYLSATAVGVAGVLGLGLPGMIIAGAVAVVPEVCKELAEGMALQNRNLSPEDFLSATSRGGGRIA